MRAAELLHKPYGWFLGEEPQARELEVAIQASPLLPQHKRHLLDLVELYRQQVARRAEDPVLVELRATPDLTEPERQAVIASYLALKKPKSEREPGSRREQRRRGSG